MVTRQAIKTIGYAVKAALDQVEGPRKLQQLHTAAGTRLSFDVAAVVETILAALRESSNINEDYIAGRLQLSIEDYRKLEAGGKRMTVEIAKGPSDIYKITPEYFFGNSSSVNHHNIGVGSNSNSGYIHTYQNYPPELLLELIKSKRPE